MKHGFGVILMLDKSLGNILLENTALTEAQLEEGLLVQREKGIKLGRRRTKPKVEERIRELRKEGKGMLAISRELGIGTSVVMRVCAST